MKIGELAQRAGVRIDTVRYYERQGLLPPPVRQASGYRSYAPMDISRLRFVRRAKALGFTLEEIAQLLALDALSDRDRVRALAENKVADLDARIADLRAVRRVLVERIVHCAHGQSAVGLNRITM